MIKRGLALIVAVFAMVQLAGGTLPAEAEEPAAMYETVTRADGGVAELVETDARRTMTVRTRKEMKRPRWSVKMAASRRFPAKMAARVSL